MLTCSVRYSCLTFFCHGSVGTALLIMVCVIRCRAQPDGVKVYFKV
jgi:hypothetical protein